MYQYKHSLYPIGLQIELTQDYPFKFQLDKQIYRETANTFPKEYLYDWRKMHKTLEIKMFNSLHKW